MINEKLIEEAKEILGNLFVKYRGDEDIVAFSQFVDKLLNEGDVEIC